MAVNLSPIGNDAPFVDASGNPLSGGLLYAYQAGSSTPLNTYTTSAGSVANANPVVLDSGGYPSSGGNVVEIWLTAGQSYKFVLKTSAGVTVWTRDNIFGINDSTSPIDQWIAGPAPTYVSATSFTVAGDQTSTFQVGRRVRTTNSGGTVYGTIITSAFSSVTTVTVINDSGSLDSGLSAVSYSILSATNPSLPTPTNKVINASDYGAVGDGTTDDLTPLTNFINALLAAPYLEGRMANKIYAISGSLPNINVSGIRIIGYGPYGIHDVGSVSGTVIKAISGCTGTMLTIAPTEGAGAQYLRGIEVKGITFDCNDIAAKGVVTKSMRYCDYDFCVLNAGTTGWEMNVSTTLGDPTSTQYNRIRYVGRQSSAVGKNGVSLRLIGTSAGNPSLNWFELVDIFHKDAIGIIEENADNNLWGVVRIYRDGAGSATNSIEWRGGATSGESCRAEQFLLLSATVAPIAKGTGTYTVGAQNIVCTLDDDNSTPSVTVEAGATAWDGRWVETTPTPTAGSGSFTTVACTLRTKRDYKLPQFIGSVTITNAGTAAGLLNVPLPYTNKSGAQSTAFTVQQNTDGHAGVGAVNSNTATLYMGKYDGNTLIATGKTVLFSGRIEVA